MIRSNHIIALASLLSLATSCVTQPHWQRYELCFGLSRDGGKALVSEQEWESFEEEEIAPRFPDGFTITQGIGHWSHDGKTYSEPTEILMVVASDSIETQQKLDAIAQAYAQRFEQDAVLQITSSADVEFHSAEGK